MDIEKYQKLSSNITDQVSEMADNAQFEMPKEPVDAKAIMMTVLTISIILILSVVGITIWAIN